jgi:hypothetical protein
MYIYSRTNNYKTIFHKIELKFLFHYNVEDKEKTSVLVYFSFNSTGEKCKGNFVSLSIVLTYVAVLETYVGGAQKIVGILN